jgi:spore germination cell wall hydrolase CwlJ-like protein
MYRKFRWASAVALVGTLFTVVFATQGTGAAAETMVPRIVLPDVTAQFISTPVVQPLPDAEQAKDAGQDSEATDPASLPELVAEQDGGGELSSEMRCLAGAIYFEARGESLAGQLAVGRVVVNRASSGRFPGSYCGVVYQPEQFSFVRGRSMPAVATGSGAWRKAVAIARIADKGLVHSLASGALYFHSSHVAPRWRLTRLAQVDNHVFYR